MRTRALVVAAVAIIVASGGGWTAVEAQTASGMTSAPPPGGAVGTGYLHQFTVAPPLPDTTFTVTAGGLPSGLVLSPVGFVTGVPVSAGTFGPTTVCGTRLVGPQACQTFTITIIKRVPSILPSPSRGGPVGTPVRETAFLIGAVLPTGFVVFSLFSDPGCRTQVFSSTNAVVTVAALATSDDFTPTAPGTYRWTATYSGDADNAPARTPCDPSNVVTITGSAPSSTTTSPTTTTSTSTTTTTTPPTSTTTTSTTSTSTTAPSTTSTTRAPTTTSTTRAPATTTTTVPRTLVDSVGDVAGSLFRLFG